MNGYTVTAGSLTAEDLFSEVLALEKAISALKSKLLKIIPPVYGSNAWWESETQKSLRDYEEGRYKVFSNVKDLMKDLGV